MTYLGGVDKQYEISIIHLSCLEGVKSFVVSIHLHHFNEPVYEPLTS